MRTLEIAEVLSGQNEDEDFVVLRHGYADYMRDYEVYCFTEKGGDAVFKLYQFVGCVDADCRSLVAAEVFVDSLDDGNVMGGPGAPHDPEPDGFVWGVRSSSSMRGIEYLDDEKLERAKAVYGQKFKKARISTEAFDLCLIFLELREAFIRAPDGLMRSIPLSGTGASSQVE